MRLSGPFAGLLTSLTLGTCVLAKSKPATTETSGDVLPEAFKPPQAFENTEVTRTINLDKVYARQTIIAQVKNVDKSPQTEYYLPFAAHEIGKVGGLEVRDKSKPDDPPFEAETVAYDAASSTQFYRIRLPNAVTPKSQITLHISYSLLSPSTPLPAKIDQTAKQYLLFKFSAYVPSAYLTKKQTTKLKLPSIDVPDYTTIPAPKGKGESSPQKQGVSWSYGPYSDIPAGATEEASVRYEFTKPVNHVTYFERDMEISHWGGNLATEERYHLTNNGANLAKHFSRAEWTAANYYNPTTSALKELKMPLAAGTENGYFIDDIGNVSTSHFRGGPKKPVMFEIKPRYPVFGGWNYKFKVGWDMDLSRALRRDSKTADKYVLKVPFLEGPKQPEGIEYERVVVRVILPEDANDVSFATTVPLVGNGTSLHKTFMDTLGRTTLTLEAVNLIDDHRDHNLFVTYSYSSSAGLRKPVTIFLGVFGVFIAAWLLGRVDVSIGGAGKSKSS